eukprot:2114834-Rhodomonas_salina.2
MTGTFRDGGVRCVVRSRACQDRTHYVLNPNDQTSSSLSKTLNRFLTCGSAPRAGNTPPRKALIGLPALHTLDASSNELTDVPEVLAELPGQAPTS